MEKLVGFNGTEKDRDRLVVDYNAKGFRLLEEQRHFDGNRLIFTNEPYIEPEKPRDLAKEIDALKAELVAIKTKVGMA